MKIARPTDPYSPEWEEYWKQNPHMLRGVGADAAEELGEDEGEGDDDGEGEGEGENESIDPKEFHRIKSEYEKTQSELQKLKKKQEEIEKHRIKAEKEARKAAEEAAKKNGDVESLEKSWQEKLDAQLAEKDQELERFKGMVSGLTVGQTAALVSAEVFGEHAELMQHHVESRLTYELTDDGPKTRVLDKHGNPSAMSIDDLKKEFKGDKRFAAFIVGTKASGPGGHGGPGKSDTKTITRSEFDKMDPASRTVFHRKGGKVVED